MDKKLNVRWIVLFLIIVAVGTWRAISQINGYSIANFTPIGALALFGGSYFKNKTGSYMLPIMILLISDIVLMKTIYHDFGDGFLYDGWFYTYGAFLLMVFIGEKFLKQVSLKNVIIGSFLAAFAHYVVVDFAVWIGGGLDVTTNKPYTRDLQGLINCYILAIPFFKNLLLSNLIYSTLLFGGFEFFAARFPVLAKTGGV